MLSKTMLLVLPFMHCALAATGEHGEFPSKFAASSKPASSVRSTSPVDIENNQIIAHLVQVGPNVRFQRTLEAEYFYICPIGGARRRAFQWEATWTSNDNTLVVSPVKNINSIGQLHIVDADFLTNWAGNVCFPIGNQVCSYLHIGTTTGRVTTRGIIMDLIKTSVHPEVRPVVTELCTSLHSNVCPAGTEPTVCSISHIDISIVL